MDPFLRLVLLFHLFETQWFYFLAWLIRTASLNPPVKYYLVTSFSNVRESCCCLSASRAPREVTHTLVSYHLLHLHLACIHFTLQVQASINSKADATSPKTSMTLEPANRIHPTYMKKTFIQIWEKFSVLQHQHDTIHSQWNLLLEMSCIHPMYPFTCMELKGNFSKLILCKNSSSK